MHLQLHVASQMWNVTSSLGCRLTLWSSGLRHSTVWWVVTCVRRNKLPLSSRQKQRSKNLPTTLRDTAAHLILYIRWFLTPGTAVYAVRLVSSKFQQNPRQHWRICFVFACERKRNRAFSATHEATSVCLRGYGHLSSAEKGVGRRGRYKLPEPDVPEGAPVPEYVAHVFVFLCSIILCRMYKLTSSDQAQVTLQLESVFPI
jgi:hypothetical protein